MTGVSSDSRSVRPGDLFFALAGDNFDGHDYAADALAKGAVAVVVSRDAPLPEDALQRGACIRVPDTRRALGDLARYYVKRWRGEAGASDRQVLAITGSNGKTTVKDMTHHALSPEFPCRKSPASFNNDVGVPHSIFQLGNDDRIAILEMGTNNAGEIRRLAEIACPSVGLITNIGETHLEALGSVKGVARAKAELLESLPPGGIAVLNADDAMTPWLRSRCACDVMTFGASDSATVRAGAIQARAWGSEFELRGGIACRLPVPGMHNVMNALAAVAACVALGVRARAAAERLADFKSTPMRLSRETVGEITIINDAYNANIRSMEAALDVLGAMQVGGRRVMLCGDMLELGSTAIELHRQLGKRISDSGVRLLVTVGRLAGEAGDVARRGAAGVEVHTCDDVDQAADRLSELLRPRDVLLVKGSRGMGLERAVESIKAAMSLSTALKG